MSSVWWLYLRIAPWLLWWSVSIPVDFVDLSFSEDFWAVPPAVVGCTGHERELKYRPVLWTQLERFSVRRFCDASSICCAVVRWGSHISTRDVSRTNKHPLNQKHLEMFVWVRNRRSLNNVLFIMHDSSHHDDSGAHPPAELFSSADKKQQEHNKSLPQFSVTQYNSLPLCNRSTHHCTTLPLLFLSK